MGYYSIIIIVPVYNEESNISNVIKSLKNIKLNCDILIINDGSTDNSIKICENYKFCKLINLPYNIGIGGAVQTGFIYANRNNYDLVLQFDGDGQHLASEITKIVDPIIKGESDVVIGSRFYNDTGFKSTFARRIGIKFISLFIKLITNMTVKDVTSGFRAYNKNTVAFLANNYTVDYPEPESLITLYKNNYKIKEVSVNMVDRVGGKSSISFVKSVYYIVKVILSISIMAFKKNKIVANNGIT